MEAYCRIELFGGLRVIFADRIVTRLQTKKTGSLLAFLACHPGREHSRDALTELIWEDGVSEITRHKLRMALTALRREFEACDSFRGEALRTNRLSVCLSAAKITTDVADFEGELAASLSTSADSDPARHLEGAITHYKGELLPEFYEEWVAPLRRSYEESYLGALRRLIRSLTARRELERAIEFARRAVEIDPLREEAQRDLMRLLAATGQPSAALRQYRELEEMLISELHSAPSLATISLAQQLVQTCRMGDRSLHAVSEVADRIAVAGIQPAAKSKLAEEAIVTSLPLQLTRFFGRKSEIAALSDMLAPHASTSCPASHTRLVTLTGLGGSGKTRLAIETSTRLRDLSKMDVWFVPLADVAEADSIAVAIEHALNLPHVSNGEPLERVVRMLRSRQDLLILDNLEHLVPHGISVIEEILRNALAVKILVTSRRILGIAGEQELQVEPMSHPERPCSVGDLSGFASVEMFIDRARLVRPDFELTNQNAAELASICQALEGIPLAIELAASRMKTMSLSDISANLDRRLDLLVTRKTDIIERHRSLRDAIRWSYDLLSPEVQIVFTRLSVFRGGFTADAVRAVCVSPSVDNECPSALSLWTRDSLVAYSMLEELCDSGLIHADSTDRGIRFRILETIREFAEERLDKENMDHMRSLHASYFVSQAKRSPPSITTSASPAALDVLEEEYANFIAALEWELGKDGRAAVELCVALSSYWWIKGDLAIGRRFLQRAIDLTTGVDPFPDLAQAFQATGRMARAQGDDHAALSYFKMSLEAYSILNDIHGMAAANRSIGVIESSQGNCKAAREHYQRSLDVFTKVQDKAGVAATLNDLGLLAFDEDQYLEAGMLFEESLSHWNELGDPERATTLSNLGLAAMARKQFEEARRYYQEALDIRSAENHKLAITHSKHNFAILANAEGDSVRAITLLLQAIGEFNAAGAWSWAAESLEAMAFVRIGRGELGRAAKCLGAADSIRERIKGARRGRCLPAQTEALQSFRREMNHPALTTAYNSCRGLSPEAAIDKEVLN